MGKKEINKPEITVETFNRAIRTYQREDVSYLLAHGILKQVPEDENVCDTLFTLACQCGCVEKKLDFLATNSFNLFLKNSSNQTVIDLLQERIRQGKYPKKCVHWQCHCLRTCSAYYCRICFFFWFRKE